MKECSAPNHWDSGLHYRSSEQINKGLESLVQVKPCDRTTKKMLVTSPFRFTHTCRLPKLYRPRSCHECAFYLKAQHEEQSPPQDVQWNRPRPVIVHFTAQDTFGRTSASPSWCIVRSSIPCQCTTRTARFAHHPCPPP